MSFVRMRMQALLLLPAITTYVDYHIRTYMCMYIHMYLKNRRKDYTGYFSFCQTKITQNIQSCHEIQSRFPCWLTLICAYNRCCVNSNGYPHGKILSTSGGLSINFNCLQLTRYLHFSYILRIQREIQVVCVRVQIKTIDIIKLKKNVTNPNCIIVNFTMNDDDYICIICTKLRFKMCLIRMIILKQII